MTIRESVVKTLVTGAVTSVLVIGNGKFPLPRTGTLVHVSVHAFDASTPPFRASAAVEIDDLEHNRHLLGEPRWVRGGSSFGQQEGFFWDGHFPLQGGENHILFYVRNNTGSTITWEASWAVD